MCRSHRRQCLFCLSKAKGKLPAQVPTPERETLFARLLGQSPSSIISLICKGTYGSNILASSVSLCCDAFKPEFRAQRPQLRP